MAQNCHPRKTPNLRRILEIPHLGVVAPAPTINTTTQAQAHTLSGVSPCQVDNLPSFCQWCPSLSFFTLKLNDNTASLLLFLIIFLPADDGGI
jgi:hypothetical protein